MTIEALLHNGKEMYLKVPMEEVEIVSYPQYPATPVFKSNKITCPDCKKNLFALFKNTYRHVCWCVTETCRKKQAEASRAKARGESLKEKETGAEKWIGSTENHRKVQDWLKNQKTFLVIQGVAGSGKSYLAAAILNFLHEKGEELAYVTHRRFIEEIHLAMQHDKTQHSVMPRYSEKKFLIIDDLGSATCTEWQQEMILELIDRRYSNKQKTIITTNFTTDELKKKLGERTASRLLDKTNEILEFWSTDRRSDYKVEKEKHWTEED